MTIKNLTLNTTIVTALLTAPLLVQHSAALADDVPQYKTIEDRLSNVRLIIKREGLNGETYYDTKIVPLDNLVQAEAELLSDPSVIRVERDMPAFTPRPQKDKTPATSYGLMSAAAGNYYNDPLYDMLDYFQPNQTYNSRIQEAHERLDFANSVTIGVVDGGFANREDVNWIAGYGFDYGRGPAYFNSDPVVGCTGANLYLHGDRVAQISGAKVDNALGTAGIAPAANFVAGRVFDCNGFGNLFSVAEAVSWMAGDGPVDVPALSEPVDVINLSLGSLVECPGYMQDAIDTARAAGIPVVVATGNEGNLTASAPANCDGVIAVASVDAEGDLSDFANTGPSVDIVAQGEMIAVEDPDGSVNYIFGTSFSTPVVAGMIAATLTDLPNLTPADFDRIVSESGKALRQNFGARPVGAGIMDSMLFLDSAGIAREVIAAQIALAGDREQFADALNHPAARAFLQAQTGGDTACNIVEVSGEFAANPTQSDTLRVFSVASGSPLDPTNPAVIFGDTSDDRIAVSLSEINAEILAGRKVGVARCDVATGNNCSIVDNIRGFDTAQIETPQSCI